MSAADTIRSRTKARALQACMDDWAMDVRKAAQEKMRAAVEKDTHMMCSQQEAERLQKERADHEKVSPLGLI